MTLSSHPLPTTDLLDNSNDLLAAAHLQPPTADSSSNLPAAAAHVAGGKPSMQPAPSTPNATTHGGGGSSSRRSPSSERQEQLHFLRAVDALREYRHFATTLMEQRRAQFSLLDKHYQELLGTLQNGGEHIFGPYSDAIARNQMFLDEIIAYAPGVFRALWPSAAAARGSGSTTTFGPAGNVSAGGFGPAESSSTTSLVETTEAGGGVAPADGGSNVPPADQGNHPPSAPITPPIQPSTAAPPPLPVGAVLLSSPKPLTSPMVVPQAAIHHLAAAPPHSSSLPQSGGGHAPSASEGGTNSGTPSYGSSAERLTPPGPSDMEKVFVTLMQFVRDWTDEGHAERELVYGPIKAALAAAFPKVASRHTQRVLVPGSGLSRLLVEIAAMGFQAQGNEMSALMYLAGSFIMDSAPPPAAAALTPPQAAWPANSTSTTVERPPHFDPTLEAAMARQNGGTVVEESEAATRHHSSSPTIASGWRICPFVDHSMNLLSRSDQFRQLTVPDITPSELLQRGLAEITLQGSPPMQSNDPVVAAVNDPVAAYVTDAWSHHGTKTMTGGDDHRRGSDDGGAACPQTTESPTDRLSLVAGEFIQTYNQPDQFGCWDAIVTCFFIDTARNCLQYLELIERLLKPGGVWINCGPLYWHFPLPAPLMSGSSTADDARLSSHTSSDSANSGGSAEVGAPTPAAPPAGGGSDKQHALTGSGGRSRGLAGGAAVSHPRGGGRQNQGGDTPVNAPPSGGGLHMAEPPPRGEDAALAASPETLLATPSVNGHSPGPNMPTPVIPHGSQHKAAAGADTARGGGTTQRQRRRESASVTAAAAARGGGGGGASSLIIPTAHSIEFTQEEIEHVATRLFGPRCSVARGADISTTYAGNARSMKQQVFKCPFLVVRKGAVQSAASSSPFE